MKKFLPLLLMLGVFVLALTGCSACKKSTDTMKVEQAPAPLSPGTASVEAEVVSSADSENGTVYKLKILKVLGYGSSTPVLSEDTEMEIMLSKTLEKQNNLESGKTYSLLLRSSEMKGEDKTNWQISKINK